MTTAHLDQAEVSRPGKPGNRFLTLGARSEMQD